jgi:hypothetical protein
LITLLLFSLIFPAPRAAEPAAWIAFQDTARDLYGFKNLQGKITVPARYTQVQTDTFRTIALVLEKDEWIAVNRNLKTVFHPFLIDNGPDGFPGGLIRITEENKAGFGDCNGRVVIPPRYDFVLPFAGDFAAFYSGGAYGCADGPAVSPCEHHAWINGRWGIINRADDTVVSPTWDDQAFRTLDISTLTDKDPHSASSIPVPGKGKTYYLKKRG